MKIIILIVTLLFTISLFANDDTHTEIEAERYVISGYIRDGSNGEDLIGATVYIKELKTGTVTNVYGYYSLSLSPGVYCFVYTYLGYETVEKKINLNKNIIQNVELSPSAQMLTEVSITAEALNANITRTEMSVAKMDAKSIEKIPALMGEVDVIKAMQLLPGVSAVSEGGSGFSVRGGSVDQNLIILDEANVYNASHLIGFFSVFNNDVVKDLKLYKGDIPAEYGGRLSSVVDIRMKDGNTKKFHGKAGIGTISSRLTLEGPLWEDRTSFIVAGRRTYMDIFLPLMPDTALHNIKLYFYDLNAKLNHKIDDKNRIFFSGYFGRDVFKNQFSNMIYGNATMSARWNHLFSQKLFSNLTFTYSNYYYSLGSDITDANSFIWVAEMDDIAMKYDFGYFATPNITLNYGVQAILHDFQPGIIRGVGEGSILNEFKMPQKKAIELAAYVSNEHKVLPYLTLKYGLRLSGFVNYDCDSVYFYDQNYAEVKQDSYTNKFFGSYMHLEPRLGFVYLLSETASIKGSYTRNAQYLQLAQNSNAGTPLDIWFSSSNNVKSQVADQVALGYFNNFFENRIEGSIELFYKNMQNTIDFKDFSTTIMNEKIEGELRYGTSRAYGAEFLVRYNFDKLTGWVSYTLSKSERKIDEVNEGKTYVAPFDKPHDVSIVANYEFNKRITFAANWVYSSGNPATFPSGRAVIAGESIPIYTGRNQYRLPAYHRLDFSFTLKNKEKPGRKWDGDLNFSVYNVYNRKNPWAINFVEDDDRPGAMKAVMTYLFPIIPSISYNIKF